ncbi:AHH domain-containing protein [Marinomonas spartinae]|uniref:AHH domain-containing protein n=1 Tax=Marinomonas spartinae TaxID=1792290 RepID=UPI0018F1ED8C|nr:AHH domain-containing protein [Marinomonas spartinae]MBJ7553130.1 AHH domain-containing protein [Marinomonas spartinae]
MQPLKHYPQPERPSDPTPLEMAIYNYELKAKAFYDKKARLGDAKEADVTKRLNQDYKHLEQERKRLKSITVIQEVLEKYREESRSSDEDTLMMEEHHPTQKLASFLTASGEPKPSIKHEAHHIIPGKGRFQQPATARARLFLHGHGLGINDPMNGVWLYGVEKGKKEFDWATSAATSHRRIHRYNYETWISSTLGRHEMSSQRFISLLQEVKLRIKNGMMPQQVMMKKDESWDGLS